MDSDKVIIAVIEKDTGFELRINDKAYGNIAVVGLLEQIKFILLEQEIVEKQTIQLNKLNKLKYDA